MCVCLSVSHGHIIKHLSLWAKFCSLRSLTNVLLMSYWHSHKCPGNTQTIPELIILISLVLLPHFSGWRLNLLQQLVDIKPNNSNKKLEDADVLMSSIWDGNEPNLHLSAVNWTEPFIGQAWFQLLCSRLYQEANSFAKPPKLALI